MQQRDRERLCHIVEYCEQIDKTMQRYGGEFSDFESDTDYQKSVAFSVLQIGELCTGLSEEFKTESSDVMPWKSIKGMRNLVVHNYGNVDRLVLWETILTDIPGLKAFCQDKLQKSDESK